MRTGPHYDFDHYRQLVHEITQAFCGISNEVLEIKRRLGHEFDRPELSEHIAKLQSKEKEKLELVGNWLCPVVVEGETTGQQLFYNTQLCENIKCNTRVNNHFY